ncbi:AtpZ/AtpI family protein [Paenibacillus puldeungensis]|uniref:AtpZ/AtpI family protein n=1 Tax=Paenibacillus puldeungensis TaxID=696536 RepID=A0ABW3S2Z3_9BACL
MGKPTNPGNGNPMKAITLVTALGINLAVCTVGGYFLGSWLDRQWLGNGLGIGLGVLIGIAAGISGIFALIKLVLGGNNG